MTATDDDELHGRCDTCRFWDFNPMFALEPRQCRYDPPKDPEADPEEAWPCTFGDGWCSKWQPLPAKAAFFRARMLDAMYDEDYLISRPEGDEGIHSDVARVSKVRAESAKLWKKMMKGIE